MTVLLLLLSIGLSIADAGQTRAPSFEALYARSQERQKDITSLSGQFVETTVSSLLVDPIVARGSVIAVKSGRVVMSYVSPEPRTVIVDGNRLIVHWPKRDQIETLNIAETQQRVRKYFTGASPADLAGFFDITVSVDPKATGIYLVDMKPRRDQIKQALERLQIRVDEDTTLMTSMRMVFPGGDSKEIRFEDMRVNVPVDESLFTPPAKSRGAVAVDADPACSVVIAGGGPAGSTAATMLRKLGHSVVLLEKTPHPRFHIGESLLPFTMPLLRKIDFMPTMERAGFVPKWGSRFMLGDGRLANTFYFSDGLTSGGPGAYQVTRSRFDHLLLEHCRGFGADVREGHAVKEVSFEADRVVVARPARRRAPLFAQRPVLRRRDRSRCLHGDASQAEKNGPGAEERGRLRAFRGRQARRGPRRGEHDLGRHPRRLDLVHPSRERRDQHRRRRQGRRGQGLGKIARGVFSRHARSCSGNQRPARECPPARPRST